ASAASASATATAARAGASLGARTRGGRSGMRSSGSRGAGGAGRVIGRRDAAAQFMAATAARFVQIGATDDDAASAPHLAVGAIRGAATHHADGERLGDVFGD